MNCIFCNQHLVPALEPGAAHEHLFCGRHNQTVNYIFDCDQNIINLHYSIYSSDIKDRIYYYINFVNKITTIRLNKKRNLFEYHSIILISPEDFLKKINTLICFN